MIIPNSVTNRRRYISALPDFARDELMQSVAPPWFSNTDILTMVPMSIALLMPEWKICSFWSPRRSAANRRCHKICETSFASDDIVASLLPPHPIMPTLSLSPLVPLSIKCAHQGSLGHACMYQWHCWYTCKFHGTTKSLEWSTAKHSDTGWHRRDGFEICLGQFDSPAVLL